MAAKKLTFNDLKKMAERYGVEDNPLFASASARYIGQTEMIEKIRADIDERGLMMEHTNVKGEVNMDINPLAVQMPKYVDAANKTLAVMLDVIQRMGTPPAAGDKLGDFLGE